MIEAKGTELSRPEASPLAYSIALVDLVELQGSASKTRETNQVRGKSCGEIVEIGLPQRERVYA
jgi:hypothetical protein